MTASCTRCDTALEDGDLRCAICALPVPFELKIVPAQSERAHVLRCTECNAAVAFSADVQAPRCRFCGQTMAIEQPVDPLEVARVRIPFRNDRDDAEGALRGWLGERGWFAPRELREEAVFESLSPLYWAGWQIDAYAHVTWTADSDEGARKSKWAPHGGELALTFDQIIVPASRGLRRDECMLLVPYYDLSAAVPIEPGTEGDFDAPVENFDAQRSAARDMVQRAIATIAKTRVEPHVPGRRFRNVRVASLVERQTTERVALPAWVLAYRYRGTLYRAIVHGQRRDIVFGTSPLDVRKVALVVGAIVAVLAAIAVFALTR